MSNPNQVAARALFDAGYFPFALPANEKTPPRRNYTGWRQRPSDEQILEHIAQIPPDANVGASLPVGTVGLDVDTYAGKAGGSRIVELEKTLGPLPPTTYSTRRGPQPIRGDQRSAIYLFQLPAHVVPNPSEPPRLHDVGDSVETVYFGLRYLAVAPSSVDGMHYSWYLPDGTPTSTPPLVTDLPVLPDLWAEYLLS